MIPERHVWIFNGEGGRFPGGVFTTRELAEAWIEAHNLTGILTAYPLDEGSYEWASRMHLVTGSARERSADARFVGSFSSASQAHFHYRDGRLG